LIDNSGRSALYFACKNRRKDIVELLIEKGATVIIDQEELVSDLCIAAARGDLELLELFHKSEVDLNILNYDDKTLQYIAKVKGHTNVVEFLTNNLAQA
jgi:ankyrin repeat protein